MGCSNSTAGASPKKLRRTASHRRDSLEVNRGFGDHSSDGSGDSRQSSTRGSETGHGSDHSSDGGDRHNTRLLLAAVDGSSGYQIRGGSGFDAARSGSARKARAPGLHPFHQQTGDQSADASVTSNSTATTMLSSAVTVPYNDSSSSSLPADSVSKAIAMGMARVSSGPGPAPTLPGAVISSEKDDVDLPLATTANPHCRVIDRRHGSSKASSSSSSSPAKQPIVSSAGGLTGAADAASASTAAPPAAKKKKRVAMRPLQLPTNPRHDSLARQAVHWAPFVLSEAQTGDSCWRWEYNPHVSPIESTEEEDNEEVDQEEENEGEGIDARAHLVDLFEEEEDQRAAVKEKKVVPVIITPSASQDRHPTTTPTTTTCTAAAAASDSSVEVEKKNKEEEYVLPVMTPTAISLLPTTEIPMSSTIPVAAMGPAALRAAVVHPPIPPLAAAVGPGGLGAATRAVTPLESPHSRSCCSNSIASRGGDADDQSVESAALLTTVSESACSQQPADKTVTENNEKRSAHGLNQKKRKKKQLTLLDASPNTTSSPSSYSASSHSIDGGNVSFHSTNEDPAVEDGSSFSVSHQTPQPQPQQHPGPTVFLAVRVPPTS